MTDNGIAKALNGWHLDKRVPLALIVTLIVQGVIAVWWLSDLSFRVREVEAAEAEHAAHVEQLVRDQDARYERIVRLEEQLGAARQQLDRIEKKLDSLGPR